MWKVSANPVNPEEAIAWFRARLPLPKADWQALEERARRKAFTVAGVAQLDLLAEVWESLGRALEQGTPYAEWAREARGKLEAAWGRKNSARLEVIFRTNVQMAYSSGRWAQMEAPEVKRTRPYRMYDAILDSRTTSICKTRHGTVLPADDPWWERNWPPLHFNCRSGVRPLTELEARQRGITQRPTSSNPQAGFGNAPQSWEWGPEPQDYPPPLWGAYIRALGQARGGIEAYLADLLKQYQTALGKGDILPQPNPTDWIFAAGRVAVARFPDYPTTVRPSERYLVGGQKRASSLTLHHRKRIEDGDINPTASEQDYEETLRRAATDPGVGVVLYNGGKGPVLGVLAHADQAIPQAVRGPLVGRIWYVVYSLRSAVHVTAYSADSLTQITIPEDSLWLRKPDWLFETP